MTETMDPNQLMDAAPDIAPLRWVLGEIRTALNEGVDRAKAFLGAKHDVDSLRKARASVHQANGALRMLNLRGVVQVLEAIEQLLKHWEAQPRECLPAGVRAIESTVAAVVAYLEGVLAGRPNQPIRLFPYYRDVLVLSRAPRIHAADLIFPDLSRRPAFHHVDIRPLTADQLRVRRVRFEGGLLGFLRDPQDPESRAMMRDALADLEHLPQRGLARSFWWVVHGLMDALAADGLPVDVDLKRVLARLNQQLRRLIEGGTAVAERLMVDALYYVGRAQDSLPRVAEVKRLYGLDALIPADFERPTLTAVDPDQLRILKEALTQAKAHWSQIAGGVTKDVAAFAQEVQVARRAVHRLGAPALDVVLETIGSLSGDYGSLAAGVRETLAIEVASALLFLDLGVEDLPHTDAPYEQRARAIAERLMAARNDLPLPDLGPWLTELARRAQDRLTMSTVVAETQGALREVEQRLDRFFRDPGERGELAATPAMIDQVCGVLALLGHDEPVAALRDAQQAINRFTDPSKPPRQEEFARIASNLGAIGFFIETLGQETDRPRGMFRWDTDARIFSADLAVVQVAETDAAFDDGLPLVASATGTVAENVEASAQRHIELAHALLTQLARSPADMAARRQLDLILPQLGNDADLLDDAALKRRAARAAELVRRLDNADDAAAAAEIVQVFAPTRAAQPALTAPLPVSEAAADAELQAIFIEEANEVLDTIETNLDTLRRTPADQGTLTTVRRAFHTLKGSSRMVGLKTFGEGAWSIEQCFNLWLSQERAASGDLIELAAAAHRLLRGWIGRIAANAGAHIDVEPLIGAANRVREGGAFELTIVDESVAEPALEQRAAPVSAGAAEEAPALAAADLLPAEEEEATSFVVDVPDFEFEIPGPVAITDATATITAVEPETDEAADEIRRIGPVAITHGLYSVFLNESDECIRTLAQDVSEWRYEPHRPVSAQAVRRAHSLAGIAATVGLEPVLQIADPLDDLMREMSDSEATLHVSFTPAQFDSLERVIERLRGMLHQFAAGVYPEAASLEAAAAQELLSIVRAQTALHEPIEATSESATAAEFADTTGAEEAVEAVEAVEADEVVQGAETAEAAEAATAVEADEITADHEATASAAAVPTVEPAEAVAPPAEAPIEQETPVSDETAAEQATAEAIAEASAAALFAQGAPASPREADVPRPAAPIVRDELDADLLPVFLAEGNDLLPAIGAQLRVLAARPNDRDAARELMRQMHTMKGSARMAGAMRLGDVVHEMETSIDSAMQLANVPSALVEDLHSQYDHAVSLFERLQSGEPEAAEEPARATAAPAEAEPPATEEIVATVAAPLPAAAAPTSTYIRVRADVLDKLVDHAGEVSIARAKLENEVTTLRGAIVDLTDNIQRLRSQLREVEIQADAQIHARSDQLSRESAAFDPLEFDRYTRLQELTRMLRESVEDVAMVQGSMLKGLQRADVDLTAQSRLTRELQQQLLRVRLVTFANVSERLYRVARQAAKELDKRVNLDIRGGKTEIDRGVLEKMGAPFEHLVRNAIAHGIEPPQARRAAGKPEAGEVTINVRQEGNEIIVVVADDGAGLDLAGIRERGIERGLISADQAVSDRELMELIFAPGFTTANAVTELAGRGVGMDVVRAELASLGGRIAISTEPGRSTRFTLYLPLTLAVTQVVLAKIGERRFAIPAGMVEHVQRYKPSEIGRAISEGMIDMPDRGAVVLRPLAQLLGTEITLQHSRQIPLIVLRSGDDRLAIAVDDVSSNQEVVVKTVGPQVSRLAGILGATILGDGEIVLIVNPVQLIQRAPEPPQLTDARFAEAAADDGAAGDAASALAAPVQVMVVDDSLTVRRVTQRLLERHGYDVRQAKDGVDALRQLQEELPDVMLVDIEMPRMDGFDLTRNVRGNAATRGIPIIMITSRTAEKHRRFAFEIGVNEYLGKPYQEDELLAMLRRYAAQRAVA